MTDEDPLLLSFKKQTYVAMISCVAILTAYGIFGLRALFNNEYQYSIVADRVEKSNNISTEMKRHSRVVCLTGEVCHGAELLPDEYKVFDMESEEDTVSSSVSSSDVKEGCTLSDPSYQTKSSAPSTCNVIHELDFNLPTLKYLAKGNYKIAWDAVLNKENGHDEHYVMKTVVYSKVKSTSREVNRNTRDALIMERAGRAPISYENNVLPMYQYCATTTIVPFATNLPLDTYIKIRTNLSAEEMYHLALQAARGLYQMHAYKDGKATYVHADIKPAQFLLFDPPPSGLSEAEEEMDGLPVLQINDFNRGKYVTRSSDNEECAFQWCGIKHKGSTYRSPEEYVDCGDQTSAIDVFSLGGVFFYILTNGLRPYFHTSFSNAVKNITHGEIPKLPDHDDYKKYLRFYDEEIDFVTKRAKHPLLVALQDVMKRCWSFNPSDRPTSLEVVQMLLSSSESVGEEATE
jgi:hypothetical protein